MQWITDERRFLWQNMYLSLYCKGSKRLFDVLWWEGAGDRTKLQHFDPTLMAVGVVFFSFSRAAQPEAQGPSSLLDDDFLYCILSATSLDPKSIGGPEPLQPGVAFPTTSRLYSNSNCLTSVLTELYNSSTPTQSPTRSLEWHVWSSSSRNNCHSSQVTLLRCTSLWVYHENFCLSHFVSQVHLRYFSS